MGRDKALLPLGPDGRTMIEHAAICVRLAAGSVTIIGNREIYGHIGLLGIDFPVIADLIPDCGPMGGLYTILKTTTAAWNLVTACDMPNLSAEFLRNLLLTAVESEADCVIPKGLDAGLHPLCAAYHQRCLPEVERLIAGKCFTMHRLIDNLQAEHWFVSDNRLLANVNSPVDVVLATGTKTE